MTDDIWEFLTLPAITREYYGDDRQVRPNDHCYWDDWAPLLGWHENDDHLKERLKQYLATKGDNSKDNQ